MAAITTNEMIFRTLKTKVWNYKGERNPEPKYAEHLRELGYTVESCKTYKNMYDMDARWMVNGKMIRSCDGKDCEFYTANKWIYGMANIGKIDFVHLFEILDSRIAKNNASRAHDNIIDNSFYAKNWRGNSIRVISGYNATIDRYKSMKHHVDQNCKYERDRVVILRARLTKIQKELEAAEKDLIKAMDRNAEQIEELDGFLKEHGVR